MKEAQSNTSTYQNIKEKFTFNKTILFILGPILLALVTIFLYIINANYVSTDDAYIKMGISSLSPQINGVLSEIKVKNTELVKKDDIILTIDKTPFNINVEEAEANLATAINQIKQLKAGYSAKLTQLESAKIGLIYYKKKYNRINELYKTNSISQAELEESTRQLDEAIQTVNNVDELLKQQLASLDNNVKLKIEKYSLYLEAKAHLDKAKFDLDNTIIYSPFDGSVANLYAKEGSFTSKGVPLVSIIDNKDIWIEAHFKETQLTKIKPGQKATIIIDSFPDNKLQAKVIGITRATGSEFSILPAQNSSGNWVKVTQRINVRLEFDDLNSLPLSSGMSVTVTVDTKSF